MTENLVQEFQDADNSLCFLLSNHRNSGTQMNTVNIQGSTLCWGTIHLIRLGFSDWLWLESGPDAGSLLGVRAWGAEKRLISQERTMSLFYGTWKQLHRLDAVGWWESGLGAHVWAQWYDSEALCLCVSSGDVSLLHSKSHLWTFQTLLITTTQCVYITWFFPQLSHSSCLVNIHFPHVKKVLRTMSQAPDAPMLKSQTENLGVFPVWVLWSPDLHLSLSVEILVMDQGVPASVFLPGGTRAPQVQTMSSTVRWSQWSRNPGQIEAGYHQVWHGHYCERDWHPPGQFTDLRAVIPGLDRTGQICWC